ncbi:GxxExxY protein [Luteolibacter flavescens]|uniref:GxxExxY protein n=1 Tax=Luteolibacter flavescens TaxID=1859460 RepID=A0ABT3FRK7_9BACT|nr:GxxExxY protein [Luteolibacter flavescens]MCW1886087.1 GxxExxY protein [Luteolibacter flavescens]
MEFEDPPYLYAEESRRIISSAMAVHNEVGHGFREKTYENSLVVAFRQDGIEFSQQPRFPVFFRGVKVDDFVPDLIAFGKIIVDAKTVDRISAAEIGQMINYLRVTKLKLALLLNFKNPKLEIRRVVL